MYWSLKIINQWSGAMNLWRDVSMIVYIYKFTRLTSTWKPHFEVGSLLTLFIVFLLAGCSLPQKSSPVVSSIFPSSGRISGGTLLTISGNSFVSGAAVAIGSNSCAVLSSSSSQIICTSPANLAGIYSITVTNPNKQNASLASAYTYVAPPVVSSVSLNSGALAGGAVVAITGSGFSAGATANFGGTTCASLTVVNATLIICTTGAHTAGVVNVVVTNPDTQTGTGTSIFTYQAAPVITGVLPVSGFATGLTTVTITGSGFYSGATASFGGSACTNIVVVSATSITCTTSAHAAGIVNIVITNPDTQTGTGTSAYTYRAAPTITSVAANAGALAGGTAVTITGTAFYTGATITIGGVACTIPVVVSTTSITCTTAAHAAGVVNVIVTNADTQSGTGLSTYTYQAAPIVASVTPNAGALGGGTAVSITGSGFLAGAITTFGGKSCTGLLVINPTTITCTTPLQLITGAVNVVVTNSDSQSGLLTNGFTYNLAPSVTSVSTNSGVLAGGAAVTITGSSFLAGATASFGAIACTGLTVVSATSITCTTPAHAAGVVNVVVTNPDTQSGTGSAIYTYRAAPTITSVAANAGALAGGTAVTIIGTGFYTGATITFGGIACTSVTVINATSLTCTTPAHAAGAVSISITNVDTQSGNIVGAYTYQAGPTVASVSPSAGPLAGLATVNITGTGFIIGATVTFGETACTAPIVISATSITCSTPAHAAGVVAVVVSNADTQSGILTNGYIYIPGPTVSSVTNNSGMLAGGTAVTITGTNFIAGATVDFGGSACASVVIVSSTTITCTTSAHVAGAVTVKVTNSDSQFGSVAGAYTYRVAPTVTSVSPNSGVLAGGGVVTVTGTGFYTGAIVDFGGSACGGVTVVSTTSITCTLAAHAAGAVTATVTNSDTQFGSVASAYTYQAAPTVTSVSVVSGFASGGTGVTITGTGFIVGATVDFSGSACTGITVVGSTTITCTTAAHAAGTVNITVTNADAQPGIKTAAYTYVAAPIVSIVSLNSGALAGGTAVTITGSGFLAGPAVTFGGTACTAIIFVSSTSITCTTPAHAAGAVNVVVTNTDTQSGAALSAYTYRGVPTVTSVFPLAGMLAGGTAVTITGSGFYSGATASFGGSACTNIVVVSSTSITCTTTTHAAGTIAATVTNADTQLGSAAAAFTYQAAPTATTVAPASGFAAGGTAVTITGTGFLAGATASLGGATCASLTVVSTTSITCTTAIHAAGVVNVVITNTDTQTGTTTSGYTYMATPTTTNISPAVGSINGATSVTITGTGFNAGATASFGGAACGSLIVVSPTSITCITGAHAAGVVNVVVTNTDTQIGSLTSGFTYQSMADLKWQVGVASPTPANPDSYGVTSTNVTHTYTLKNTGDIATTTITLSKTGSSPAAWLFGTDTCSGTTLASNATCTIQVTFLGQFLTHATTYAAVLNGLAITGGTATNNMNGSTP
jgi:hypothetical protein